MPNYRTLLENYLTHYQPEQKAELMQQGILQAYLDDQVDAMKKAKEAILEEMARKAPETSQLQREMEADQMVRDLFLPLT